MPFDAEKNKKDARDASGEDAAVFPFLCRALPGVATWRKRKGGWRLSLDFHSHAAIAAMLAKRDRSYFPMDEEPNLFQRFIEAKPTRAGFLEFIDRYGRLGLVDESFDAWVREHADLSECEEIRRALADGDGVELAKHFTHTKDGRLVHRSGEAIASRAYEQVWFDGDLVEPARAYIAKKANSRLRTELRVALFQGSSSIWNEEHQREGLVIAFQSQSLLGVLWLQLARAVASRKSFATCIQCGHTFEVGPGPDGRGKRRDSKYCSDVCRYTFKNEKKAKGGRRGETRTK